MSAEVRDKAQRMRRKYARVFDVPVDSVNVRYPNVQPFPPEGEEYRNETVEEFEARKIKFLNSDERTEWTKEDADAFVAENNAPYWLQWVIALPKTKSMAEEMTELVARLKMVPVAKEIVDWCTQSIAQHERRGAEDEREKIVSELRVLYGKLFEKGHTFGEDAFVYEARLALLLDLADYLERGRPLKL